MNPPVELSLRVLEGGEGPVGQEIEIDQPVLAPKLVGLHLRDARAALRLGDLRIVVSRDYSRKPKGSVLRQIPAPGLVLQAPALSVAVVVARPIPLVPDVSLDGLQRARAKLQAKGYRVRVLKSTDPLADVFEAGTVLEYRPSGRVMPHRIITLEVVRRPQTEGSNPQCDGNYADGCVPIASDVDCGGGSGNGPAYVWESVRVVGSDVYDLDRDGDRWGCE